MIPVSEVQVRQVGDPKTTDTDTVELNYSWELVHLRNQAQRRSEKIYLLSNSTGEFRNAFLRNIRQIIRESVRNMSLPPKFGENGTDDEYEDDDRPPPRQFSSQQQPPHKASGGTHSHYATPEGCEAAEPAPSTSYRVKVQAHTLGKERHNKY